MKKIYIILISIIFASLLMSKAYGLWYKNLSIEGNISIVPDRERIGYLEKQISEKEARIGDLLEELRKEEEAAKEAEDQEEESKEAEEDSLEDPENIKRQEEEDIDEVDEKDESKQVLDEKDEEEVEEIDNSMEGQG